MMTMMIIVRSGRSLPSRRRRDPLKSLAFSPEPISPEDRPAPARDAAWPCSARARLLSWDPSPGPSPPLAASPDVLVFAVLARSCHFLRAQLRVHDLLVGLATVDKVLVLADAADAALLEHDDLVGVQDGADPLRDHDHGRVLGLALESGAQHRIGLEVERREAVVEDVDVGLLDERASDGEPLALAAGDVGAALGDGLVKPSGMAFTNSSAWAMLKACHSSSSVASGSP